MKKSLLIVAACAAAAVGLLLYYFAQPMSSTTALPTKEIHIGSTTIVVEVADDHAEVERGLSGRAALPEGKGMLFVFDHEDKWGIWMKDMNFPIDILFLSKAGEVVSLNAEVSPSTYPETFYPSSPVMYVLELPAGYAARHGVSMGSRFDLGL